MTWVLDLDGVVWLGGVSIDGSAEAVEAIRASGSDVAFLTNNSSLTTEECLARLSRAGIPAGPRDVLSSAQAAASLVEPGSRVFVCAGPGVRQAVEDRGAVPVDTGPAETVVVGWHREFDYERLTAASNAVRDGARLVGTNDDATYPTPDGAIPGGGSLLAAVAYASESKPAVAGKPHEPTVRLLRARFGGADIVVGDRPSTDGALARRLGCHFGLVLSGVTPRGHGDLQPRPDFEADDLRGLVALVSREI